MRRRLPRPALLPPVPARTSFSRGDRPAAAARNSLAPLPRPRRLHRTHARFSPSCDSFFPPEPTNPPAGVRVCLYSPLHRILFFSLSSPSPAWCAPLSFLAPLLFLNLFIFIWLRLSRALSSLLCLRRSLPPSGSLLSPRSGASGAPPLARRDVARGDVDAGVSGALDVCVLPGPGLQGRRRPLRRLLEQQQPQVRQWGRRAEGTRASWPCGRRSGGGDQRAPAASGARSEPASPGRRWLSRLLQDARSSLLSLLSRSGEAGRPWESSGLPRSQCLCGALGDLEKAGAGVSRLTRFPSPNQHPDPRAGLGHREPRVCAARSSLLEPGYAETAERTRQTSLKLKKNFFFSPFPCELRERRTG